jgi:DNA-binding HxlR family transcriptional regulator
MTIVTGTARDCAVVGALQVVGDFWSLAILRSFGTGPARFAGIQEELGIAPNILSNRLGRLVEAGVLDRLPYQERPLRHEYSLTARGRELEPVLVALKRWGEGIGSSSSQQSGR